jgi:hypothetical protein
MRARPVGRRKYETAKRPNVWYRCVEARKPHAGKTIRRLLSMLTPFVLPNAQANVQPNVQPNPMLKAEERLHPVPACSGGTGTVHLDAPIIAERSAY